MLEKMLNNTINSRLEQIRVLSKEMYDKEMATSKLIEGIKEAKGKDEAKSIKDFTKELSTFKLNHMEGSLMQQTVISNTLRVVEMYTVAKLSDTTLDLNAEDLKFIEDFMEKNKMDLYGVEKGKLIVLDDKYYDEMKVKTTELSTQDQEMILDHIMAL